MGLQEKVNQLGLSNKIVQSASDWPYQVLGGDHVKHVQNQLDQLGLDSQYEIVLPQQNELFIDYDVYNVPDQFWRSMEILHEAFCQDRDYIDYVFTRSMSGKLHAVVTIPTSSLMISTGFGWLSDIQRVAWQAAFGSDPNRESLSLMSIQRNLLNPTLLIEKKGGSEVALAGRYNRIEAKANQQREKLYA